MRIAFLGTPVAAVPVLNALAQSDHEVPVVITRPEQRRQRRGALVATPIGQAAVALGLNVVTAESSADVAAALVNQDIDLGVVVAFGLVLNEEVLAIPRLGLLNIHFSLLPRWRGAAPVQHAVMAGDAKTGVCVMQLEARLDTGAVLAQSVLPIAANSTTGSLLDSLSPLGADLLTEVLSDFDSYPAVPQTGDAVWAPSLRVSDFRIDPHRSAVELDRLVRAGNPDPGAWTMVAGRRLKIVETHAESDGPLLGVVDRQGRLGTASGALVLDSVQPEGRRVMSGRAWLAGLRADEVVIDS